MLQNAGLQAERSGDFQRAEQSYLQAISIKETQQGIRSLAVALTRNSLGELYMKMGRLDEAETNLTFAVEVRNGTEPHMDAAVSRENLAQLYEMRGDLQKAKEMRLKAVKPWVMVCSNYNCPGQLFKHGTLRNCGGCRSTFWQDSDQKVDWKSRHKKYCKPIAAAKA